METLTKLNNLEFEISNRKITKLSNLEFNNKNYDKLGWILQRVEYSKSHRQINKCKKASFWKYI